MSSFSERLNQRRQDNAADLAAFGVGLESPRYDIVCEGKGPDIYTIGYERRDGEDLIASLLDAGVDTLVDVRQRAMSRRADFRGKALAALCENAGIRYVAFPSLGSTDELRDELRATGDFEQFTNRFRSLASRTMRDSLVNLAALSRRSTIALLCYERCHNECHRSILAEMLHNEIDAHILAIK